MTIRQQRFKKMILVSKTTIAFAAGVQGFPTSLNGQRYFELAVWALAPVFAVGTGASAQAANGFENPTKSSV